MTTESFTLDELKSLLDDTLAPLRAEVRELKGNLESIEKFLDFANTKYEEVLNTLSKNEEMQRLNNKLNCPLQSISLNKNLKLNSLVHIDISPGISFSYILCIAISYLSKFDEHSSPLLLLGNRQITII